MDARKIESILARFTLVLVAIYLPVETYASWRYGLLNPFYIGDAIAMALLGLGRDSVAPRGAAKAVPPSSARLTAGRRQTRGVRQRYESMKFAAARDWITAMPNTGSSSSPPC
jgi:hypothetical protein